MNVLILTNFYSGLYSFRKEVVEALIDKGHKIYISAPQGEKSHYFEEMGCVLVETHFDRKGMNPIRDFLLMMNYRRIIKRLNPDVVLSYTIKPNLYGGMACQICGIPQIVNVTGLGNAVENSGWLQKLTILLYKVGLRKSHTVFFQNRANMDFCFAHKMVHGNVRLIPGSGVNLMYHSVQEYPHDSVLRFVFISRLIKEKGIEEYFGAAEIIKRKYSNVEFHIVGWCEGNYIRRLKDLENRGIVIYHGPVDDVRPFIAMSHCMVHPSYYPEGMSNVLLESCAAGRPIITTNRPGCGEIVDDSINGFVVKPRDTEGLAAMLSRFISLPYERKKEMGLAARYKMEREFDRQIVIDAYLEEISSLT